MENNVFLDNYVWFGLGAIIISFLSVWLANKLEGVKKSQLKRIVVKHRNPK